MMIYYMIKNLDTDEIVYLYKVDAFLFGGRRLFPQNITQAEYETYAEFGMPVRVGTDGLDIIIEEKDEMGVTHRRKKTMINDEPALHIKEKSLI